MFSTTVFEKIYSIFEKVNRIKNVYDSKHQEKNSLIYFIIFEINFCMRKDSVNIKLAIKEMTIIFN